MIRTYQLKHQANKSKQTEIKAILDEYRVLASKIAVRQWHLFFTKGGFNKNADIKTISTGLSERYKQTCQYQIVGLLESFVSNRKNNFVDMVCHSSLDESAKVDLLYINKYGLWFNSSVKIPVFNEKGEKIKDQYRDIEPEVIRLARKIFKHILSKHRKPTMGRINMALDQKVAVIKTRNNNGAKKFDYWVRLSTLNKGKPVYIPVQSNEYFESVPGQLKNFCQFNLTDISEITVSFIKDKSKPDSYIPLTPKIALDLGLKNIFTTNKGEANRSSQAEFTCRYCGYKSHADVNGARNILVRSSDEIGSVYKNKKLVLRILVERFTGRLERDPCRCSTAKDLILRNPYFKDYWDKFKEVS